MAALKVTSRKKRILFFLLLICTVAYFFIHKTSIQSSVDGSACPIVRDVGCARVAVVPFLSFLEPSVLTACSIAHHADYVLVVPTKIFNKTLDLISLEAVKTLVAALKENEWLYVVGGSAVVLNGNEKPACSIDRRQWTMELREKFSMFTNGLTSLPISGNGSSCRLEHLWNVTCYPCDLLPDIFLINISIVDSNAQHLSDKGIDLAELVQAGESARLPLFLELKGRSAYCPQIDLVPKKSLSNLSINFTCNHLRMIWDGNFVQMPLMTGVFRLISPESIDHWLGCTWAKMAHDMKLPIHCSNWIRQFTLDSIDILGRLGIDYRLVYGTLLGAARSGDVIPWTVDGDLAVFVESAEKFRFTQWPQLGELSAWRYSNLDRNGLEHYGPCRTFPSCPLRLTATTDGASSPRSGDGNAPELIRQTGRAIRESKSLGAVFSSDQNWRSTGYVDFYLADALPDNCTNGKIKLEPVYVSFAGRKVKTVPDYVQVLQCLYGKSEWDKIPPRLKSGWNSYSDAVQ